VIDGTAIVVGRVPGELAPYSTDEFLALLQGKQMSDSRESASGLILDPDPFRSKILEDHGRMNKLECKKLSRLFYTLHQLGKWGIRLVDFGDNVVDDGDRYVLVDLGQ